MNFFGIEFGRRSHSVEQVNQNVEVASLERGSERFFWKSCLIKTGIVVGMMAVGALVGGGLAAFLAYNRTGEIDMIFAASIVTGAAVGMFGGMVLAARLFRAKTQS